MDKSNGLNSWNISKTSGTNIIGGPYCGGNYWDDYTGSDSDGDGLGESPYTIYNNNKDRCPLIDVTPPTITNVKVTPSTQTSGSYVYISATVTDNAEVSDVYLIIKYPDIQTAKNFSIVQNKTGNIYYCNKIYSSTGTYTFYIKATDARHNWASTELSPKTFEIQEGVPPTIVDNSPSTGSPSGRYTFNATVTDDKDSASSLTVRVYWSHGKLKNTQYLVNVYGNYFEWEITLDNSTGDLSYHFYASDRWSNSVTTTEKTVSITDSEPPRIIINKYGSSFNTLPKSYTFDATITDNHRVSSAKIEYWYESSNHITIPMDYKGSNRYEKIIIIESTPERVYCIINATDPSGNKNDTKNPFAKINGPYIGYVSRELTFNAIGSFDLDGSITGYSWNFGDGTTGTGISTTHTYSTTGNYSIKLTSTDNDGKTSTNTTYAIIYPFIQLKTSYEIMNELETKYGITLNELFYSYDTDGNTVTDTFVDPNGVLKAVHTGYINLSGDVAFLISVNDTSIPEFIWNATTNKITSINHTIGVINTTYVDEENNMAIVRINLNKTKGWIYLDATDEYPTDDYPDCTLTVKANNTNIPSDRIWRKNGKIYVLDDPEIEYQFIYQDITRPSILEQAIFTPDKGSEINKDTPSITISYNLYVTVINAKFKNFETFDSIDITDDLVTTDHKNFTYTPPSDLETGTYELDISVEDQEGNIVDDSAVYSFVSYAVAEEKTGFSWTLLMILFGGIAASGAALLLLMRYKHITFDSFIYIRDKKIMPFFKPVVFGPVSIDVDDKRVNKAEFYVDGILKDTITQGPYTWKWDEKAFLKHTIETRIYDQDGKSTSTGEMTFFVFNSPRFLK